MPDAAPLVGESPVPVPSETPPVVAESGVGESGEPVERSPVPDIEGVGERLNMGELHEVLTAIGVECSKGTLRRWLRESLESGTMHEKLARLGVQADWELRVRSNKKDNTVRWLWIEE